MVSRQDILDYMQHDAYRPLTAHELVETFELESEDEEERFLQLLADLEEKGEVVRTRTNRYGVPERMNLVRGRIQMKARGFGFLIPEQEGEPDVYIAAGDLNGAMSGDLALVRIDKSSAGPRREGQVVRILKRAQHRVVGQFTRYRDHAFVSPLDKRFPQDIFIARGDMMDAHDGYVVVVEITSYPTATRGPEGRVVEVLGHPDAPGVDILAVVRKYGLAEAFPEAVLRAAEAIPLEIPPKDLEGRRDLREETIVTIDGEDAKDLDDAVQVKRLPNGNFLLGVHIADVGWYVKEGSRLDKEAYKRGTSVYLVDRVIPMLPQRLSNNICSLNPQVDRLTLSCQMEITPAGDRVAYDIFSSVIRTTERMTYRNVNRILVDHDPEARARYRSLVPMFEDMAELADILRQRRMARGAIDFDFDEIKVEVDDLGRPLALTPRERSIAERLIEEFMLAANETIAEHFYWLGIPFVYRIHEEPDPQKLLEFNQFIHNFGYHVKGVGNRVHPRALQAVLKEIEGTREEAVISKLMLRSLRQARYAPECVGHFGLAAKYYTHFTSPIRRYPDLVIHRIIREVLDTGGRLSEERLAHLQAFVEDAARQSSECERTAQDAEREVDQLKTVEYMLDHIGEEFDGVISGVTSFGLFVHLDNGAEGLIHISYLTDDYYIHYEKLMALVGERTRRVFRLGDPVVVRVAAASKENLSIDFELVAHRREATMVTEKGVHTIEYDEDLSPKERRRRIRQRAQLARGPVQGPTGPRVGHRRRRSEEFLDGTGPRRGRRRSGTKTPVSVAGIAGEMAAPGTANRARRKRNRDKVAVAANGSTRYGARGGKPTGARRRKAKRGRRVH
ncbi:ribonuclease R [Alicyclobacillus herbarius]|uniref:ribonuclease R n=1 Tax=Alicyclobacillus herbarius TaxID=122960 RepID=UPI0003F9A820|nr:ribonuclease R [Alicyclobacillus herbarius]